MNCLKRFKRLLLKVENAKKYLLSKCKFLLFLNLFLLFLSLSSVMLQKSKRDKHKKNSCYFKLLCHEYFYLFNSPKKEKVLAKKY